MHGVFKHLDDEPDEPAEPREFFDQARMRELRERQINAVGYLDGVFARLFDRLPSNTWVIVTSDHGELFGEDRYFGHGPVDAREGARGPVRRGPRPLSASGG